MTNTIETYTGKINEYVDWVTGKDTLTDQDVTGGLPVSGGSIRNLLQDKLKKPLYMYEDVENGLYRMFSSEESKNLFISDPQAYANLEIFNFVRPSDYELSTDISLNPRYLISGDSTQTAGILAYTWSVMKGNSTASDSVVANYTITDENGISQNFSQIYSSVQTSVNVDLYNYLKVGTNTVSVQLTGVSTGAMVSTSFIVVVITLDLQSSFNFNAKHVYGEALSVPYALQRNITSMPCAIKFCVDGTQIQKIDIPANSAGTLVKNTVSIPNLFSEGQHNLQIWVEMQYDTATFKSNVTYFDFVTASDSTVLNYFVNLKRYLKQAIPPVGGVTLDATQYEGVALEWGYYTDNVQIDTSIMVDWVLVQGTEIIPIGTIKADKLQQAVDLVFSPYIYSTEENPILLKAFFGTKELASIPINIRQSSLLMYETSGYTLKLSAYGKTNDSGNFSTWKDSQHNIDTTFTNVEWNSSNGWYNNSFRTVGTASNAVVNYTPLSGEPSSGRTIEIEFESEKIDNEDDVLIRIGGETGSRVEITPDTATMFDSSNNKVIYTNYKNNERIKLAFVINPQEDTTDSQLIYIINNGVLERAVSGAGLIFGNQTGEIKIGGSNSGVRVYNMRVYNRAISYTDAYNNYVFDNDNKAEIIAANNIIKDGALNYDLCINKIDTILITGDLSRILNQETDKDGSLTDITIERICPSDSSKNFKCINCQARKHGQSTLNYPITSMKIWLSKNTKGTSPIFSCPGQANLGLGKTRYKMKDTSIPANKFILQANYADSSGVSNGGIERLIHNTWYNAVIDGEYKLRTEPQLFSTNSIVTHTNVEQLNEDPTYVSGRNSDGKQWGDYFEDEFPHVIRNSPDSFPCVVFYVNTATQNTTKVYLGQYVFMEDKKSDFCYGERSIYKTSRKDPFCLTTVNAKGDTKENRIWNNKDVLRMEVLAVNSKYSSYLSDANFEDVVFDANQKRIGYKWEEAFELTYPDPDDVMGDPAMGTDKFGVNSKYLATVNPFINLFKWIVSTKDNHTKFQAEASAHLDLYKLAAYYIFCLRFGLVDSMERNAQIKTYDGTHFHYEPWDIDISFGKKNTGGIAFEPPMDRDTTLAGDKSIYAFSGRAGLPGSENYTSNWLWDALEGWEYWRNTIVPKVANAVYMAGLTYDNFTQMFDENYAEKWCEIMYNESCHYKYIDARGGDNAWLNWLQGSGTPYRHWWTTVSNDYYNAKWTCGEFKNHYVYIAGVKEIKANSGVDIINITPTVKTFFNFTKNYDTNLATVYSTKEQPVAFDASLYAFSTKEPFVIYGANNIEKLDISCIASGIDTVGLAGSYSSTLGACIKELNIGSQVTQVDANTYTGKVNGGSSFSISAGINDALGALQTIYVRGQQPLASWSEFNAQDRTQLQNVYAMGSGLANFYSAKSGNKFVNLELPGVTKTSTGTITKSLAFMQLTDSTWENMTFWDTTLGGVDNIATFTKCNINGDYTYNIPESLTRVELLGTSASNQKSLDFVKAWIDCIEARGGNLGDYQLIMDQVNWSKATCTNLLSYEYIEKLAKFNGGMNNVSDGTIKGYIMISTTDNVELTVNQLTAIKSWFGDSCFTKNSAGLVIDHELDYIQINIGQKAYVENGSVYLKEGNKAPLNATRFKLGEDLNVYTWFIHGVGDGDNSFVYKSCSLREGEDGIMYLYADESINENYQVAIVCTSGAFSTVTTVNIVTATYPTVSELLPSNTTLKKGNGSYYFQRSGMNTEFYLNTSPEFTATLTDVKFQIKDSSDNILLAETSYTLLNINDSTLNALDGTLGYIKNAIHPYSIKIYNSNVTEQPTYYTITTTLHFKYVAKKITFVTKICVIDDSIILVQNDGGNLYKICAANYLATVGENLSDGKFYRVDLMALNNKFDFNIDSKAYNQIPGIKTYTNRTILKYLTNIKELIIDDATIAQYNPNIVDEDKNQIILSEMPYLQKLSLIGNASLTETVDLTSNINIEAIYAEGSNVGVVLPTNSKISTLSLGTPEEINIVSPTVLKASGISVQNTSDLDYLDIINIPNTSTYSVFKKVMNDQL